MAMSDFEVVVVGNVGVDTNVYLYNADIDFTVEANFSENLDYVGHAGGFTARGFAQLGKRTAFIGYVGADHNGQLIRKAFEWDGIDMAGMGIDPMGTGRSVNLMYRDGRRKNFYDGKGHMNLTVDLNHCRQIMKGVQLVHFSIPHWARQVLPLVKELGIPLSCDVQDVVDVDDPYRQDFVEASDILFFSAVNYDDPTPLMERYLESQPARIIVVGMGAQGCALGTNAGIRFFPAVEMFEPVIDTNGAGDGLAVGFLTSYVLEGYSLEEAIWRGQLAARHSCTQRATSDHLIRKDALDEAFQRLSIDIPQITDG